MPPRTAASRSRRATSGSTAASVTELPGFGEGRWWVQDLAASLPARLIPADAADVLDLCAAPGGKTMQLAAAGHRVTAVDRVGKSSRTTARESRSARISTPSWSTADALDWEPKRQFDAILLDAPCSATGTFRRHPEVLYRARPAIIAESAELQAQLLDRAARLAEARRALVYSVCSLEPAGRRGRSIAAFLAGNPDFRIDPPSPASCPTS